MHIYIYMHLHFQRLKLIRKILIFTISLTGEDLEFAAGFFQLLIARHHLSQHLFKFSLKQNKIRTFFCCVR